MAGEDVLALNQRDRDRLKEFTRSSRGGRGWVRRPSHLGLSRRQARRLVRRVEREGDRGVLHRLRGRPSNRASLRATQPRRGLLTQERYRDFAPTLAAEHLARIGIRVSRETVRGWQTQAGLWKARRQKIEVVHVWRERRASFGELVLMDTSDHDWLEGRGPRLYLVAMIDDATSRLWGRFVETDSTEENLRTLRGWLELYGRPMALYTDKNSIFQTARSAEQIDRDGPAPPTHFGAALEELRIEWIPAHSPQAKGRVERSFDTLQDRLVKEMRIAGVCSARPSRPLLPRALPSILERALRQAAPKLSQRPSPLGPFQLDSVCETPPAQGQVRLHAGLDGDRGSSQSPRRAGLRKSNVLVERRLDGTSWVATAASTCRCSSCAGSRQVLPGYALQDLPQSPCASRPPTQARSQSPLEEALL